MRRALVVLILVVAPWLMSFSFSAPGSPWADGEDVSATHMNEIDTEFDNLEAPTYITKTANSTLSGEQALGALSTGLVFNTTTTGVLSIYTGTSCTNQVLTALNASGSGTCASVSAAMAASDMATQSELNGKSFESGTSTDNGIVRFDGTTGDVQNSGVTIDDSNNVSIPGTLTVGGSTLPPYTVSASAPVDGVNACTTGDIWLVTGTDAIYFCVDGASDEWSGVALGLD